VSYEEGRNGGLPQGSSKSIFLKANRRFCLPPYEPKRYVIPIPLQRERDLLLTAVTRKIYLAGMQYQYNLYTY